MDYQKVLLILGMHRSGTSLTANWLGQCGLDLGQRLIGATPSNLLGHFEDIDIVEFHENLLRFNHTDLYQGKGNPLSFNDYHVAKAKSLVYLRNQFSNEWGWKQPRALLFSELWQKVLPEAHYFFIYRPFEEVISSLYRREYKKLWLKNPWLPAIFKQLSFRINKNKILQSYLSMWIRHNDEIIQLMSALPSEKVVFISVDKLREYDKQIFDLITQKWGFNLDYIPVNNIFKAEMINQKLLHLSDADPLVKEARSMTKKLVQLETTFIEKL